MNLLLIFGLAFAAITWASITAFLLLNEWTERDWLRWFCTAAWFSFGITATLWCCNRWL
jgi:hypothetical protein